MQVVRTLAECSGKALPEVDHTLLPATLLVQSGDKILVHFQTP